METINKDTDLSLAAYCTLGDFALDDDSMLLIEPNLSSSVNALPDEIIEFILTYLPPYGDLSNCNLVCKRWNNIVKNLVRRSKLNLNKGLTDYRLHWELFSQQTAAATARRNHKQHNQLPSTSNTSNLNGTAHVPIIAGRFSHSAVFYDNSMYIFGGGSSSDTTFNDLWRFDLTRMCWERPVSMGSYPSPKGSASMVQWRDQLVLFGGWRYPSLHPPYQPWCLFDELHYYDLANNRWNVCCVHPCPPPMAGHSATVHGDRMIVFGGYQIADGINSNSNETWCLELHTQKWWQPRILGNIRPPPRYGQFQLALDEHHLLIVGGCGGPNSVYSDAWILDMSKDAAWGWRTVQVRNKEFAASHMWCHPACEIDGKLVVLGPSPNMPQDFQMKNQLPRILGHGAGAVRIQGGALPLAAHYEPNVPYRGGAAALPQNQRGLIENNGNNGNDAGRRDYFAFRRAILNQHQLQRQQQNGINNNNNNNNNNNDNNYNNNQNINNNNNNNNNNNDLFNNNRNNNFNNNNNYNINQILQPRTGRLSELRAAAAGAVPVEEQQQHQQNRPSPSNASRLNGNSGAASVATIPPAASNEVSTNNGSPDMEAANRLQRNLALRCRENDPTLPKRFDELYEDPPRMAAFKEQASPRNQSKDHNERIRRLEEKMNAIRSRRNAHNNEIKAIKEPSPKRVKRNVLSLFVCDLSAVMNEQDAHLNWMEYKNYGIIPGAPERLILSTMVAGHGELILFGGVHKETLSELTHQVSNTIHFLSAPRDIV